MQQLASPARHFSPSARGSASHWEDRPLRLLQPVLAPVTGHVHGKFEPAPDAQFVEGAAQMVLDDLLGGAHELANFAVGQTLPHQGGNLNLFWGQTFARHHDFISACSKAAVARRARFFCAPESGMAASVKKRAQVLLHGARADTQLARDFFVAATLDQQVQDLLIAGRNLHPVEIHSDPPLFGKLCDSLECVRLSELSTSFAKLSPPSGTRSKVSVCLHLGARTRAFRRSSETPC